MKKIAIAVCLIILTAAFEEKAASTYRHSHKLEINAVKSLDSLAAKIEHLNNLRKHEK